jgi:hypothetical protein
MKVRYALPGAGRGKRGSLLEALSNNEVMMRPIRHAALR